MANTKTKTKATKTVKKTVKKVAKKDLKKIKGGDYRVVGCRCGSATQVR